MTDVRTHLSRLDKPLQYATRNDFANLPKLRDLEPFVKHQIQAMQSLALPTSMAALLTQLAETVLGFDDLTLTEKRQRAQQAAQILARLHALPDGADAPPIPVPPPKATAGPAPPPAAVSEAPLAQPVQFMRGVGPRRATLLAKLSLHTVGDLLWCLPVRYEDRRNITPLGMLQAGTRQTFYGTVTAFQLRPTSRGKSFATLRLEDSSAPLTCKWFQHRGLALQERFPIGTRVVGNGLITFNRYDGSREVVHPDLEALEADDAELVHFGRLVPIYPLTAGLTQRSMRSLMHNTVATFVPLVRETLPQSMCNAHGLPFLEQAMREVHFPDDTNDLEALNEQRTAFHARLVFEEFFLLELGLAIRHREARNTRRDKHYHQPNHLGEALLNHLPFQLTAAQQRVLDEILADMRRPFPMNRLIQGDVGSGKTIVALLAMLLAVSNGQQAALMAPTEILAEQHLDTLRALLQPLNLEVALLTGTLKGRSRQNLLQRIAAGEVSVLVGTHALLYENVQFHGLGMIVVDEQHRFGVMQRARPAAEGPAARRAGDDGDADSAHLGHDPSMATSICPSSTSCPLAACRSRPSCSTKNAANMLTTWCAARSAKATKPTSSTRSSKNPKASTSAPPRPWPSTCGMRCSRNTRSACCTDAWPPRNGTPSCARLPRGGCRFWCPPPSSKSASTSPTPPSC